MPTGAPFAPINIAAQLVNPRSANRSHSEEATIEASGLVPRMRVDASSPSSPAARARPQRTHSSPRHASDRVLSQTHLLGHAAAEYSAVTIRNVVASHASRSIGKTLTRLAAVAHVQNPNDLLACLEWIW